MRLRWLAVLCALTAAAGQAAEPPARGATAAATSPAEPHVIDGPVIDSRVELHWRSDTPRRWLGTLQWLPRQPNADSTPAPRLSDPVNLTPGPILSGGIHLSDDGGLQFAPPARLSMLPGGEGELVDVRTRQGGLAFHVRARAADRLRLRLHNDDGTTAWETVISAAELAGEARIEKSIESLGDLWLGRLSGDALRIRLADQVTVLQTEQVVDFEVWADGLEQLQAAGVDLVLQCETRRASDQSVVDTALWPVSIVEGRLRVEQPRWVAPASEGPYRLHWQLRPHDAPRGPLAHQLSPVSLATAWTQSISEAIPPSLAGPFHFPLTTARPAGEETAAATYGCEFSVAVVAPAGSRGQRSEAVQVAIAPGTEQVADGHRVAEGRRTEWRVLGKAEPRDAALSVSRLLPRPASNWLSGAAGNAPVRHDGKRLTLLAPQSQLEYVVPLTQAGQRHRALIRVPATATPQFAVEVFDGGPASDAPGGQPPQPLGPGLVVMPGPWSGTASPWHVAAIDFWPRSADTRIVLTNRSATAPAKIESIEIHVDAGAQSLVSEQGFGGEQAFSEQRQPLLAGDSATAAAPPAARRMAVMRLELADLLQQFGDGSLPTLQRPLDYQQVWTAATRLIDSLHREGYGGVALTVASDGAACYPTRLALTDARWNANWAGGGGPVDALELLMRLLDRASLSLIPCVRPSSPLLALEQELLGDAPEAASLAGPSPLAGKLGNWSFDGPSLTAFGIYNPAHPAVAQQVGELLGELRRRCQPHRCVATIGVLVDERSYLRLPPVNLSDPHTLDAFHRSLGDAAPPRAALAHWVQTSGAEAFQRWHHDRAEEPFRQILQQLPEHRLLVMSLDTVLPSRLVELGREPRVQTARLHRRSLIEPLALRIRDEACNASVSIPADPTQASWSHDVGVFHQPLTANLTPLLDEVESSLVVAQLLNRSDRLLLAIGGGGANQPGGEARRRSLRCFSQLPPVAMAEVPAQPSTMSEVRLRQVRYQGDTYIYAANQTRWPFAVEVAFNRSVAIWPLDQPPTGAGVTRAVARQASFSDDPPVTASVAVPNVSPSSVSPSSVSPGDSGHRAPTFATRWTPRLAPGELLAIRVPGEQVEILDWKASFAGDDAQLRRIRAMVKDAVNTLPKLVESAIDQGIENGDFEQDASQGIAGWLTSQHPPGCVAIDNGVAYAGKQSVRLTGQSEHAGGSWMVSQVITPPASGRLAVSVRLRGEAATGDADPPLVVRMALEGIVAGTPIRKTQRITVPRNGNWSEPAERLEIALLPSVPVQSLRLTIDLMSGGVVWVDEVSLCDWFMTSSEKTQLDHLVFLAAGGAARSDWRGASRLLDSHWNVDLSQGAGSEESPSPLRPAESQTAQAAHQESEAVAPASPGPTLGAPAVGAPARGDPAVVPAPRRGLGERLKSWLPKPVRF